MRYSLAFFQLTVSGNKLIRLENSSVSRIYEHHCIPIRILLIIVKIRDFYVFRRLLSATVRAGMVGAFNWIGNIFFQPHVYSIGIGLIRSFTQDAGVYKNRKKILIQ